MTESGRNKLRGIGKYEKKEKKHTKKKRSESKRNIKIEKKRVSAVHLNYEITLKHQLLFYKRKFSNFYPRKVDSKQ